MNRYLLVILAQLNVVITCIVFTIFFMVLHYYTNSNAIYLVSIITLSVIGIISYDNLIKMKIIKKFFRGVNKSPFNFIITDLETGEVLEIDEHSSKELNIYKGGNTVSGYRGDERRADLFKNVGYDSFSENVVWFNGKWIKYFARRSKYKNRDVVLSFSYDITEFKNNQIELDSILKNTHKGIIALDKNLEITNINNQAKKFLGLNKEVDHRKYHIDPFLFKRFNKNFLQLKYEQSDSKNDIVLVTIKDSGYSNMYLNIHIEDVNTTEESNIKHIIFIYDITELETQRKTILIQTGYIEEYMKLISHDIISPINSIGKHVGLVKRYTKNQSKVISKSLNYVSELIVKTKNIISNIIRTSEELSTYQKEKLDFQSIAEEVQIDIEEKHHNTRIDIISEIKYIHADRTALYRLLYNLVDNSVKYTENTIKHVIIGINDGYFFVKDYGIGISEKDLDSLFTSFKQLNSDISGSGLGLHIVKTIANMHGWKIEVESTENQGTTFKIFY